MAKKKLGAEPTPLPEISKSQYKAELRELWIELVKLQRQIIRDGRKVLILFEGRDAAGKDGTIKRIIKHLSPREVRVVALGRPSDREQTSWYFQRFVPHLPAAEELVLFNRSWYNRAGVEKVMGFCDDEQHDRFMEQAPRFEQMLVQAGVYFLKYYLDITKDEQKRRMRDRRESPLTQWKISPIDKQAVKLWDEYTEARNAMLARTHHPAGPWTIVRANNKRLLRLNVIRDMLSRLDYDEKRDSILLPDPNIVFRYEHACLKNGMLAN